MSTDYKQSPRLIPQCNRDEFLQRCYLNGWWLVAFGQEIPEDGLLQSFTFGRDDRTVELHWVDDSLTRFPYVVVSDGSATDQQEAAQLLDALPDEHVFAAWSDETDPERLAVLALYAGILAPAEREERFHRLISEGLAHPLAPVREGALMAISYRHWPCWRDLLLVMESTEPDEMNRSLIRELLDEG